MNHVAPSMLPAGMAELITETPDSDQGSLFDLMMQDDSQSGSDGIAAEPESDVESIVMHAQGFEDFRRRGQSLKGMLGDIEQDLYLSAPCRSLMATSPGVPSYCVCSAQR